MLCSKCYKKIPEGEEVIRGGGSGIYWRAGWWGSEAGGEGGAFCLRCAKKEARREKRLWVVFTTLFVCVLLFIITIATLSIIYKNN